MNQTQIDGLMACRASAHVWPTVMESMIATGKPYCHDRCPRCGTYRDAYLVHGRLKVHYHLGDPNSGVTTERELKVSP